MSQRSNGEVPAPERADRQPVGGTARVRPSKKQVAVAVVAIGGLALVPQTVPSSSASPVSGSQAGSAATSALAATALAPPAGKSWIEGAVTDQAGHRLNNVNVEVWPMDMTAIQPVASNLSYAGDTLDAARQSGVFRLEVPAGTPYRVTFSTVLGQEDGDPYRMAAYGGNGPIMTRASRAAAAAVVAAPGRTVSLGTVQLARQGLVSSAITAKLVRPRVVAKKRGKVQIQITSPFVSSVTGTVQVRAAHKWVIRRVTPSDQGGITVRLPKLKRGKHAVRVKFLGSTTVSPSKAKPLRLVVSKRSRSHR